ncbi:hypothetical protein E2562_003427 [Oryza meyeriana var. granulata]|uniref:Uncharacterized protein n=1 Tax=Oryza meyeriana var. granulata TaxID=110450 RepID=A0A6G1EF50_9ORYZ|nr:hypothetical protein E2562_003427 [Oryza meyeriana var. granulata]
MANVAGVQPTAGVCLLVVAAAEGKTGFASTRPTSVRISAAPRATRPRRGFHSKRATLPPFSAAPWAMRCALEPPPLPEAPQPTRMSKMVEMVKKIWAEVKKNIFLWLLILFSVFIGVLAMKENPKVVWLVTVCEKAEKVHKFLSHFGPLLAGIVACFRYMFFDAFSLSFFRQIKVGNFIHD